MGYLVWLFSEIKHKIKIAKHPYPYITHFLFFSLSTHSLYHSNYFCNFTFKLACRVLYSNMFFFQDRVFLCRPDHPGPHFVGQAGLEVSRYSSPQAQWLKACATMSRSSCDFSNQFHFILFITSFSYLPSPALFQSLSVFFLLSCHMCFPPCHYFFFHFKVYVL